MSGVKMELSLARFLRHCRAMNRSQPTIAYYQNSLGGAGGGLGKYLKEAGHSLAIEDLTVDDVRGWIDEQRARGLSQHTVNTRAKAVKAFTRWLVEEEWLPKDPLKRLSAPRADEAAKTVLTPAELDAVLGFCDRNTGVGRRDAALTLLLYSTGMRMNEARHVLLGDIDWKQGLITITRGKGGKYRSVPLGGKAERALARLTKGREGGYLFLTRTGEQLTHSGFRQIYFRLARRSGVDIHPHKLRHSMAVQYLRNGGKLEALKAILGHTSYDMTLHYARLAGVDLTTAHETADPARSLKTRA